LRKYHGADKTKKEIHANLRGAATPFDPGPVPSDVSPSQICVNDLSGEAEQEIHHSTIRLMPCLRVGTLKLISNPTRHPVNFM